MNDKANISDGSTELYVLGLFNESEKLEFEQSCNQDPGLVADRRDFEEKLEKFALENAELPPVAVKGKILEAISNPVSSRNQDSVKSDLSQNHASNPPKTYHNMENSTGSVRSSGWLRFAAAASIILAVGFAWFGYKSYDQNKTLTDANNDLKAKLNSTDSILGQIVAEQKVVKDPNTTVVNMVGTKVAPKSSANVYWDSASSNVYIVVKNMPDLPTDKQYQLWALIDGKPKDLGVFDATANNKVILKMKNTQKAQAFAITIEQKGGSPSPTLDKMQSLGKLSQTQ